MRTRNDLGCLIRARIMKQITEKYHTQGSRNKTLWVIWIQHVFPAVGVDYNTYLRALSADITGLDEKIKAKQEYEWEKHRRKLETARLMRTHKRISECR